MTGGDSGSGRAVAIAFAKEGADVVLSYLPEEEVDATETAGQVEKAGRKAAKVPDDIGDPETSKRLVETARKQFGGLNVVVNNAGFQMVRSNIADVPPEELERTFRTNVYGTFFLCQTALPMMKPGESIINTCSIESYTPEPGKADQFGGEYSIRASGAAGGPDVCSANRSAATSELLRFTKAEAGTRAL